MITAAAIDTRIATIPLRSLSPLAQNLTGKTGVVRFLFRQPQPGKERIMIVIRNVFRLKFGKAREAVALFKEGIAIQKRVGAGLDFSYRLLTDLTGPFYTVVLEITVPNMAAFEGAAPRLMGDKDWQANYQKIGPLVDSGFREIFTAVE
jgi:hypothetical protein